MQKTSAWPLALSWFGLIAYASLYPFADWRDQGMAPWTYLFTPITAYWTGFDIAINVAGYAPLGALLALGSLRSGRARSRHVLGAVLFGFLLALALESLQSYLPVRVSSKEDLVLNTLGTCLGAIAATALERLGAISRWSRLRSRWFVEHARGGLVLLATWPLALLFPAAVPFGLGQVFERVEEAVRLQLIDTPFLDWLPVRPPVLVALAPGAEMVCVMLGVLIPCLLAFCVTLRSRRRMLMAMSVIAVGVLTTALSSALSWGPQHTWAWLGLPAQVGIILAAVAALLLAWAPWRLSGAMLLLALGLYLSMLNQAPESPYLSQTLQAWEQGRFIRFHGLAQWLGWLWPYATLLYVLTQIGRRDAKN